MIDPSTLLSLAKGGIVVSEVLSLMLRIAADTIELRKTRNRCYDTLILDGKVSVDAIQGSKDAIQVGKGSRSDVVNGRGSPPRPPKRQNQGK